ncbi:MAG: SUF system Fe-S cluster assembly regulator [Alphaproteobacteria bacterium]
MIRLSRLADYGVVLMTHIATLADDMHTAHAVAGATRIPEPTASKILKALVRAELLDSHRGASGGYTLARQPDDIPITEIIIAVDGPIALTSCLDAEGSDCSLVPTCPTRTNWQKINDAIHRALDEVSLADMMGPMAAFIPSFERRTQQTREL